MKKIISGILFLTPILFSSLAFAGTLSANGTSCNSVAINSSAKDILSVEKDGLPIMLNKYGLMQSFLDNGYNNLVFFSGQGISGFFPNKLIPNNNYSYNIWTQSLSGRYQRNSKQSLSIKTNCPPAVSVVSNTLNAPAVTS